MMHSHGTIDRPAPGRAEPAEDVAAPSGSALPFVLSAALIVAMAYGGWTWWRVQRYERQRGQVQFAAAAAPITDFVLVERSGRPFRSADMRGKVWVVTYFFSSCTGTCKTQSENIEVLNSLPDLTEVTWVSITCDPDNDTLKALNDYADAFHADPNRWLFCRGDFDYLGGVAAGMSLPFSYKMHSDKAVVIDRAGKVRGMFDSTSRSDCQRMRELLHTCLAESAPDVSPQSAPAPDTPGQPSTAAPAVGE
jgi:protein SCO1/2